MEDSAHSNWFLFGRYSIILVASLIAGLSIRFALLPLSYEYDIYHWAMILQNINSGNGLYELNGYFYTPVWGYVLGAIDSFWNTFLSIDVFGMRIDELLSVENMAHMNHIATITTLEFNYALKIPLIIIDVIVGTIIYSVVKSLTNSGKKAEIGFALWFLCPIAIYMSSVQGMFDNMVGLITLLSVLLVLKRYYFMGGIMLMTGILMKLYPGFALSVIIALIYARKKNSKDLLINLGRLFAGGVCAFAVLMLPTMLDGTFWQAFTFITDRSGGFTGVGGIFWIIGLAISAAAMIFFTITMARSKGDNVDNNFLKYTMLALIGGIIANLGPQYPLVVLPLMCIYIVTIDRSYLICWLLIGTGCTLQALVLNNYSLLMSLASYTGLVSFDTIIWGLDWTEAYIIGTNSFRSIMNTVFSMIAFTGLILAIIFHFQDVLNTKIPKIGKLIRKIRSIEIIGGV